MTKDNRTTINAHANDLKNIENRYRMLFERSPDAVIVTAPDGSILDFNPAALRLFDVSADQFTASTIIDYYANVADRERLISQVNETGLTHDKPIIFVDIHGQLKHTLITTMLLQGPDEQIYAYQSVIRDITKRRLAEKKLEAQKNYAEHLVEGAPEAIAILNLNDHIVHVNKEFCRLFEYPHQECIGRDISNLIVPEHLKAKAISFSGRAAAGDCFEVESQRMRKDGVLVDVSILATPIALEDGTPGIYAIYRDITARKLAEEKLKKSEARHRTVLEAAPDPVIVRNMQGKVIYLNPAFTRVFGWTLDECRKRKIDFVPEENQRETQDFMKRIRQGKSFSGVQTRRIGKDGRLVDVSISGAVFFNGDQQPEGFVNTLQDITEHRKKDEELRYVAYHDQLTGLPNRKSFYTRLDDLLTRSRRRSSDRTWALMFLDLDKFKQVNDTLGHDTGDQLLKAVSNRLKGCMRETDHLFRLGGDEFTVILTNLGNDIDVARVAEKIIIDVSRPFHLGADEIFTTTSVGISVFPNDGWNVEGLVKNADIAMYEAKESGGNGYRFFTEEMNRKALHRMQLENSMRKALERDELMLYYQPLVDTENRIIGLEALLRWRHPELGIILPSEFIRLTEETGIIVSVGRWVLQTACTQAKHWQDMGFSDLFMAVNLSARQFQEPDFVKMVVDILEETGLPAKRLKLEVTESSVIQNPEICIAKMNTLRDKGVTFAIDDFGTGYSSLSYLKRFPIDTLKIDRSFISDTSTNRGDREIIKTIIAMARNMNIDAVAEGVETQDQKDFLVNHGCKRMQGFLFAQALPVGEISDLLERQQSAGKKRDP